MDGNDAVKYDDDVFKSSQLLTTPETMLYGKRYFVVFLNLNRWFMLFLLGISTFMNGAIYSFLSPIGSMIIDVFLCLYPPPIKGL